ncbi:DUF167 domain-containing protein [Candidatus Fermentibacteria bacterium]|nr:DUF167 domain-containing protein [Candidatus Fermentibacteria bacterium]
MEADGGGGAPGVRDPFFLPVVIVPGAVETVVAGRLPDGAWRIRVKAPPMEGRANAELVRFVASEFGVPRSSVSISSGSRSRRKLLRILGAVLRPGWLQRDGQ